jgi:hypothetical protein
LFKVDIAQEGLKATKPRNRKMNTTVATQRQKAVQAWVRLRAKREAVATAKPPKHGKKSST